MSYMDRLMFLFFSSDYVIRTLLLVNVISVTIMLERAYAYFRIAKEYKKTLAMKGLADHKSLEKGVVRDFFAEIAQAMDKGISEATIDLKMNLLDIKLNRGVTVLGLIATLAPMIGLVGTFIGVFHVFEGVSTVGLSDPLAIARGIKEVLVDTVAGLLVAIPAMVGYKGFEVLAHKYSLLFEERVHYLIGVAKNPATEAKIAVAVPENPVEEAKA